MHPTTTSRQAHRLIQIGLSLFLVALLVGVMVPHFSLPRLGLSAHLLGVMQGIFLVLVGMLWPRLRLTRVASRLAFWLLIYGCLAAWTANLLGAIWRAGNTLLPMAAGSAHGTPIQETVIAAGLRSAAVSLIVGLLLLLWGTRSIAGEPGSRPRTSDG